MWMQMRLVLAVAGLLLITGGKPQGQPQTASTFCASRTPEALHSPKCPHSFVVKDPHRVDDVTIQHSPPYHTYSRWVLSGRGYVFAYRDIDEQPEDMAVDIYRVAHNRYLLVGSARIPGVVTNVSTVRLTGGKLPDVVFRFEGGQLKYIEVVRLADNTAREVFRYGASTIDITSNSEPVIEAISKIANLVEQFAWDARSGKFRKVEQHPWHMAK
jgi:hypothetical protein